MGMKRLRIFNFDNMENNVSDAIQTDDEFFIDDESGTAYAKISSYLALQEIKLYLGHDNVVYPHFQIADVWVR